MTALRAEWTKLRSLRSTTWMLLALVGLTIALGIVSCSTSHTEGGVPADGGDDDVVMFSLAGVYFAQIAAVAFGVLAVCSEYATGTIRTTFAANPRRREVLAAKTAIVGALVLGCAAVAALAAFFIGQAILHTNGYVSDNGYPAASLGDADTLRKVAIAAVYPVVLAGLSLGAAAILRNTAAAISVLLGLLFVPWIVGSLLPEHLGLAIERASPMAGIAAQERGAPIGPWAGFGVTVAWAVGALVVALWLVARRDA
jgi:ABC-type transport system involved in multi-copper enzyme maturation permease subunit